MDLIPVLSTIILVATLATLLFSVTAYIVYKVKERRVGELPPSGVPRREQVPEQLETPPSFVAPRRPTAPMEVPVFAPSLRWGLEERGQLGEEVSRESFPSPRGTQPSFWVYTPQGYVPLTTVRRAETLRWR